MSRKPTPEMYGAAREAFAKNFNLHGIESVAVEAALEAAVALMPDTLNAGGGRIPDREAFWLVERNTSPPQYVSTSSAGWHPDVWQARRFKTERQAHDYWRSMDEQDRAQFRVVEHLFINRIESLGAKTEDGK